MNWSHGSKTQCFLAGAIHHPPVTPLKINTIFALSCMLTTYLHTVQSPNARGRSPSTVTTTTMSPQAPPRVFQPGLGISAQPHPTTSLRLPFVQSAPENTSLAIDSAENAPSSFTEEDPNTHELVLHSHQVPPPPVLKLARFPR